MRTTVFFVGGALAWAILVACSGTSDFMGSQLGGDFDASAAGADGAGGCVPAPTHAPIDPSTLASCCTTGAAHCVPTAQLSSVEINALAPCQGGACVPDALIKSGGGKPPTCASLNNAPGVCLSVCVPQVAQYASLLPQATCASDERCAPCVNPLTGASSGACSIGETCGASSSEGGPPAPAAPQCPYAGPPLLDPTTLPACDPNGGAHCLATSLVPAAMRPQLAPCTDATTLCVPDAFIASGGNFVPPTCASIPGGEGRCLQEKIPQVASQPNLPRSSCATFERCVPCWNPLDGADTGACHLSCDPGPTQKKILFQGCCDLNGTPEGKCVPASMVPSSEQSQLARDVCTDPSYLCAPAENLGATFKPPACTAFALLYAGNYDGVCLSDCLKFTGVQGLVIKQGSCDAIHQCVPCKTPTGAATGAPGCP